MAEAADALKEGECSRVFVDDLHGLNCLAGGGSSSLASAGPDLSRLFTIRELRWLSWCSYSYSLKNWLFY